MSPEEFFDLVHRHVSPAMAERGFACLGDLTSRAQRYSSAPLTAGRPRWTVRRPRLRARRGTQEVLSVGYEHGSEDDERWVHYLPGTEELDLGDWRDELAADPGPSRRPGDAAEVERRLELLGRVLRSA